MLSSACILVLLSLYCDSSLYCILYHSQIITIIQFKACKRIGQNKRECVQYMCLLYHYYCMSNLIGTLLGNILYFTGTGGYCNACGSSWKQVTVKSSIQHLGLLGLTCENGCQTLHTDVFPGNLVDN